MPELDLAFPLAGGLHARPATALREWALGHRAELSWRNLRTGRSASLRSVLGLLATETRLEDPCRLTAVGPGAEGACQELADYLAGPFLATDGGEEPAPADPAPSVPRLLTRLGIPWWPATPMAPGLGEGPACLPAGPAEAPARQVEPASRKAEAERLQAALDRLDAVLRGDIARAVHPTQQAILRAHAAMLADEGWREDMVRLVREAGWSAETAVYRATEDAAAALARAGEATIRSRALDLRGLGQRLRGLLEAPAPALPGQAPMGVLLADQLSPSAFLALDRHGLRALVLGESGATSHTAILARSFGVPCVALAPAILGTLQPGRPLLVDGHRGLVVPDPPPEVVACLRVEQGGREARAARFLARSRQSAVTRDGTAVKVLANLASPDEATQAFALGADGVGLFRTEMLFLDREAPPPEPLQEEAYRRVLEAAGDRPVVLRLLDAGGDKPMPFLPLPQEPNPFLGRRGVRWYARHADLVRAQVRAALRASGAGNLRLMVPMVTAPGEVRWVRSLMEDVARDLAAEDRPVAALPPLGMMVEVPAAALCLEPFAASADFFSVGTNDLLQYLFAEDRGAPDLGGPARAWHPAALRLLDTLARAARSRGREASLCGEAAADPRLLPLFLGLGFRALSVSPAAVPALKSAVADLEIPACEALAAEALDAGSSAEVSALLDRPAPVPDRPLVDPGLVVLDETCASKEEAIRRLVERLACAGRTLDPDRLEAAIWAREDTYSTGIGHGVAVPHCKGDGAGGLAVLRLREALPWGALDGEPVRLVLLLASSGEAEAHLRSFARLARRLMDPAFREGLLAAPSPEALASLLESDLSS